ncbi:hypothetical protein [Microbulbifer sp. TYP-18]|uniref:hypothetical protein n=1 Tax=Microbulbifer sp. TYP-18 TaxID=3230024 RepID=UPI0034C6794B
MFDPSDGRIRWTLDGTITLVEQETSVPDHLQWIWVNASVDANEDYVVVASETIAKRPRMKVSWEFNPETREVVVNNIPAGARLTVPNWQGVIDDGFVVWPVAEPGVYRIEIDCFPYHSEVIRAEVA